MNTRIKEVLTTETFIYSAAKAASQMIELQNVFEAEYGRKPTDKEQRLMEAAYQVGIELVEMGRRHRKEGHEPASISEIQKLTAGVARAGLRNKITQLMYENYMFGYRGN